MSSATPQAAATALVTLITDEQSARSVTALVAESLVAETVAISSTEIAPNSWAVAIYCLGAPDKAALRGLVEAAAGPHAANALRFGQLAAKDWVGESLAGLKPVAAGRFIVHGAHDRASVPANRIGIEIEAALAFGTGHHGTTRGCLLALDRLGKTWRPPRAPRRILDLGTGTGVLAIAAARALRRRVLATDIDTDATRVARGNATLNGAAPLVHVVRAAGLNAPAIRAHAPFDLVFANILLRPLQGLAAPLTKMIAPGGHVIMSGLLAAQANAAQAAYHALTLERRIIVDGWATLVLRRPHCPAPRRFID